APVPRAAALAGELRELLCRERRRLRADVRLPGRRGRVRDAARLLPGPAPRGRGLPRVDRGPRRAALPHAAGARRTDGGIVSSISTQRGCGFKADFLIFTLSTGA